MTPATRASVSRAACSPSGGRLTSTPSSRCRRTKGVRRRCRLTTISVSLAEVLAAGVQLLQVRGEPRESRRLLLVQLPGPVAPGVAALRHALVHAQAQVAIPT
jgi:hypothetical protein